MFFVEIGALQIFLNDDNDDDDDDDDGDKIEPREHVPVSFRTSFRTPLVTKLH